MHYVGEAVIAKFDAVLNTLSCDRHLAADRRGSLASAPISTT
jgi:hypothetical protein